jgi:hypothetical protein
MTQSPHTKIRSAAPRREKPDNVVLMLGVNAEGFSALREATG